MKKIVNIKMDPALLGVMLDMSREQLDQASAERDAADEKVRSLERAIAYMEKKWSEVKHDVELPGRIEKDANGHLPAPRKTKAGRIKRGQSQKLMERFMKNLNGTGVSIREIAERTGTKYNTIHRLVGILERSGKIKQGAGSKWLWNDK